MPTVSTDSLFTTLVIYNYEGRDILIFGVPGEYLNAEILRFKKAPMKFLVSFIEIVYKINP